MSQQLRDRRKVEDGRNQRRMLTRRAAAKGMTSDEYEQHRASEQTERARVDAVLHANRSYRTHARMRRGVHRTPEVVRKEWSAYMLARYHADPHNWSTKKKRRLIFKRDAYLCRVCGVQVAESLPVGHPRKATAMHIVAKATGGEWTEENMATGCHSCNVRDGVNRVPIQLSISPGASF